MIGCRKNTATQLREEMLDVRCYLDCRRFGETLHRRRMLHRGFRCDDFVLAWS